MYTFRATFGGLRRGDEGGGDGRNTRITHCSLRTRTGGFGGYLRSHSSPEGAESYRCIGRQDTARSRRACLLLPSSTDDRSRRPLLRVEIHELTRISHRCEQLHGQHACVEGAHVLGWLPTEATRGLNCFGIARGGASGPRLASQGGTARRYPGVSSRIIIPRRAEGGRPQQIHFYTRFPHSVRYAQLWRRLPWVVAWLLRNWDGTDEPELPVSGPREDLSSSRPDRQSAVTS